MTVMDTIAEPRSESRRLTPFIDGDFHIHTAHGLADVFPYMPQTWRRHFELKKAKTALATLPLKLQVPAVDPLRIDAVEHEGDIPASDPVFTAKDHLDRYNVEKLVATSLESASFAISLAGPDEAAVLVSAFNDYFLDTWYGTDQRYRFAMTVSSLDVEQAVAEIHRKGAHPGVAAIYLPWENLTLANRKYYPIYAAAQEYDLPILLHLSGQETVMQGAPNPAGGLPDTFAERRVGYPLYAWSQLGALTFSTVFQRFPSLRFVFVEFGFTWLLPALWRFDSTWRATRIESPWLTERPSDLLRKHVRFTTDNIDEPDDIGDLYKVIDMIGSDWLIFGSDYPHWDGDSPGLVLNRLAPADQGKVMRTNAEWMFRL